MIDLDELERLAKESLWTGAWNASCGTVDCAYAADSQFAGEFDEIAHPVPNGISDYIAAAQPVAVLALIAEVRRLREVNAELSERGTLLYAAAHYADSVCAMLRQGGWPGKAEALEGRIKAVIDFDAARAEDHPK